MTLTDKILVIDLEATCWEGEAPRGQISEVIEIGTCLLDTRTGDISDNEALLIKPGRSTVSQFCTQLTTITGELLEQEGISFLAACKRLQHLQQYTWASYGAYDLRMMRDQCARMQCPYPLSAQHINVKEWFSLQKGLKKKPGMKGALDLLGLPLMGTHHRGVDDARNIASILYWCLQQKQ
ncbi:3'-5' exonuclease [Taibaiella koreensis]|uniref:3'-5' exonuclease n=1 Tax=Taibaiella koreensis TaxID=1268548 RepID=UPI000E59AE22|nr:3'-5' exonuclease [Taibaiella koreensis]